jgi:hypothetical protein
VTVTGIESGQLAQQVDRFSFALLRIAHETISFKCGEQADNRLVISSSFKNRSRLLFSLRIGASCARGIYRQKWTSTFTMSDNRRCQDGKAPAPRLASNNLAGRPDTSRNAPILPCVLALKLTCALSSAAIQRCETASCNQSCSAGRGGHIIWCSDRPPPRCMPRSAS